MKTNVGRIYLPCQEGVRRLINLEKIHGSHGCNLKVHDTKGWYPDQALLKHQWSNTLHSVPRKLKGTLPKQEQQMMWMKSIWWLPHRRLQSWSQNTRDYKKLMKETWTRKPMHVKFPKHLDNEYIDAEQSFQRMENIRVKGEREGLIITAQDQADNTRYYHKHIMKGVTDTAGHK